LFIENVLQLFLATMKTKTTKSSRKTALHLILCARSLYSHRPWGWWQQFARKIQQHIPLWQM